MEREGHHVFLFAKFRIAARARAGLLSNHPGRPECGPSGPLSHRPKLSGLDRTRERSRRAAGRRIRIAVAWGSAEPALGCPLRPLPGRDGRGEELPALLRQPHPPAAAVRVVGHHLDQAATSQGLEVRGERRAIHRHLAGQGIDLEWAQPFQLHKDRVLGRAQTAGREELIIELRDMPRRRPDGEFVYIERPD